VLLGLDAHRHLLASDDPAGFEAMQAVAIVHPEFSESACCHQEIGWALGRGVPSYAIQHGRDTGRIPRT
jgi:hypothetical protein